MARKPQIFAGSRRQKPVLPDEFLLYDRFQRHYRSVTTRDGELCRVGLNEEMGIDEDGEACFGRRLSVSLAGACLMVGTNGAWPRTRP